MGHPGAFRISGRRLTNQGELELSGSMDLVSGKPGIGILTDLPKHPDPHNSASQHSTALQFVHFCRPSVLGFSTTPDLAIAPK
jgi:hypothetical protein